MFKPGDLVRDVRSRDKGRPALVLEVRKQYGLRAELREALEKQFPETKVSYRWLCRVQFVGLRPTWVPEDKLLAVDAG